MDIVDIGKRNTKNLEKSVEVADSVKHIFIGKLEIDLFQIAPL